MRKFLPFIFILLILVNIFAPFGFEISSQNAVKIQKAEAADPTLGIKVTPGADGTSAIVSGTFIFDNDDPLTVRMGYLLGDSEANLTAVTGVLGESATYLGSETLGSGTVYKYSYQYEYTGLTKGKTYYAKSWARAFQISILNAAYDIFSEVVSFTAGGAIVQNEGYDPAPLPDCGISDGGILGTGLAKGTVTGCAAQLIYYVLFIPTSYIFALTGQFFDFTFSYSVNDVSYRSPFVVQGWGIVRDFCNIFFIFVMLYIAFSTILNVHGFKTKEMIINVVIIGLLINFSLFAAQVIIDSSNILARVFYNSDAIKITQKAAGVTNATPGLKVGPNGEIPLSAAIVNKVNPQNLIIQGRNITDIEDTAGTDKGSTSFSAGSFILITLLAVAVNVVGIIAFISIGMIFIARVIGLWFSMIFAPLAFFSYMVPQMQSFGMIGWKKWWPELLSMAFLAPVFIFFIYLILAFLETGLSLINIQGQTGVAFVISTVVPFVFIMVLLLKAKSIAKDMSGKMGQAITGAIAAIGAVTLGSAALSSAALLRNTVGSASKFVQNDKARRNALGFKDTGQAWQKSKKQWWNPVAHVNTAFTAVKGVGKASMAGLATGINATGLGKKMRESDEGFITARIATTTLDNAAAHEFGGKAGYEKDVKYSQLKEHEQEEIREEVDKNFIAKKAFGEEDYKKITDTDKKNSVDKAYGELLADRVANPDQKERKLDVNVLVRDPSDPNKLKWDTKQIKGRGGDENATYYGKSQAVGEFVNALRKGSMDIRNLSKTKVASKGFGKFTVGLLAAVAAGTRAGLKQSGINHGTGQKDFIKDLGSTISDALKTIKVDVKTDSGDHGKGHASAGGGGGHH